VDLDNLGGAFSGSVKMSVIGSGQNFQWTVQPVTGSPGVYQIVSPYKSSTNVPLVLDADNAGGVLDGHVVQVMQNGNQANQKWWITEP